MRSRVAEQPVGLALDAMGGTTTLLPYWLEKRPCRMVVALLSSLRGEQRGVGSLCSLLALEQ